MLFQGPVHLIYKSNIYYFTNNKALFAFGRLFNFSDNFYFKNLFLPYWLNFKCKPNQ